MENFEVEIKRRILIIGANGLLGQNLVQKSVQNNDEILAASIEDKYLGKDNVNYVQLDITKRGSVKKVFYDFLPHIVINAAAFTNVDGCETQKELCWKVNVFGVKNLVELCRAVDAKLIHLSTDFVFDGEKGPYNEIDIVNPVSYYGRSKLAGENEIIIGNIPHIIVRTNVLYGTYVRTSFEFVSWVVESLRAGRQIRIVDDQYNNPTYVTDLANGIFLAIDKNVQGIYNIGGIEILNRLEFTYKISEIFELDKNLITPIKTHELNQKAKRPLKSGLIILKAQTEFGYVPGTIEENLKIIKSKMDK